MKVLSLFDGMACGMIAFKELGIPIERYVAYEIDKFAVKTATHNFPQIEEMGDVFAADFNEYRGFDWLIGGSPCTYWSIAQTKNRETEASGMGWELFSQYVRALNEAKPKYFLYENNKSMSDEIRKSISDTFRFEPIYINSALVSAQNRQRLYWVGKRNADGTYSKVDVKQPVDRGILLKDILDSGCDLTSKDKSYTLTASYNGAVPWNTIERNQRNMVAEPVATDKDGKAFCLTANYAGAHIPHSWEKGVRSMCEEPIRVGCYPSPDGTLKNSQGMRLYSVDGKSVNLTALGGGLGATTGLYAVPLEYNLLKGCVIDVNENRVSQRRTGKNDFVVQGKTITFPCAPKVPTLTAGHASREKILSQCSAAKIYNVVNKMILINDKWYPCKLDDGYYEVRDLTVRECQRLQTVPDWYEFPVSKAQAYKMLGNGWTVDVIKHLITSAYNRPVVNWTKQLTFDELVN